MKTKLLLTIFFISALTSYADKIKYIIQGGTKDHKFDYVYVSPEVVKCIGKGTNLCPAYVSEARVMKTKEWQKLAPVIDYVLDQVNKGTLSGEIKYGAGLPVNWKMYDNESVEINIETDSVKEMEINEIN